MQCLFRKTVTVTWAAFKSTFNVAAPLEMLTSKSNALRELYLYLFRSLLNNSFT